MFHYKGMECHLESDEIFSREIFITLNNLEYLSDIDYSQMHVVNDEYVRVYVNPEELTYTTYENILELDNFLQPKISILSVPECGISVFNEEIERPKIETVDTDIYTTKIPKDMIRSLLQLDSLDIYTVPMNSDSRGGKRMIFSSISLGDYLTDFIIKNKIGELLSNDKRTFSHVNSVFRLNKFYPGDTKFHKHHDTGFSNKDEKLYSVYTMIIYLTGGENIDGCINFDIPRFNYCNTVDHTVKIDEIKAGKCIIFDQKLAHEGNPFEEGNKIFIRTELIFHVEDMEDNPEAAYFFNKACFFVKEPGYQRYVTELFNHTSKLRYKIKSEVKDVILMKRNKNVVYMTDGQQFFFNKSMSLLDCAVITLLDYFNGKYGENKTIIESKEYEGERKDIFKTLSLLQFDTTIDFKDDFENIIPLEKQVPINICRCGLGEESCEDSSSIYDEALNISYNEILLPKLKNYSITLFNGKIHINPKNIEIGEKHIKINPNSNIESINFASCQCSFSSEHYVFKKGEKLRAFLFPDIEYESSSEGHILSIDMFNNGFVFSQPISYTVPLPVSSRDYRLVYKKQLIPFFDSGTDKYNVENNRSSSPDYYW